MRLSITPATLSSISVTTQPTKKTYIAGESFSKSGMVVKAYYNNGTSSTITNYTVTDGNNLPVSKTSVIISYTEGGVTKTATVSIAVNAEEKEKQTVELTVYSAVENGSYAPKTQTVEHGKVARVDTAVPFGLKVIGFAVNGTRVNGSELWGSWNGDSTVVIIYGLDLSVGFRNIGTAIIRYITNRLSYAISVPLQYKA